MHDVDVDLVATLVGRTLGGYTVTGLLGHGGMASVFSAYQTNLGREVALKVLPPDRARDPEQVDRFMTEARTAARLSHPNIVPVYDVGRDGEYAYMAMRLVDGPTLAEELPAGGMPLRRVDTILQQIASALDYVHAQGLIHRDVTAGNVMLESGDRVTLTDFGIAATRQRIAASAESSEGTAEYVAPEIARGLTSSARSDIYSLGVLAYELIAGRVPFADPDVRVVLRHHINTQPPPLGRFRPDSPARLDHVLRTAMAKDPAGRYSSAGAFAAALHAAVAGVTASRLASRHEAQTRPLPLVVDVAPRTSSSVLPRSAPLPVPTSAPGLKVRRRRVPSIIGALLVLVVALLFGAGAMTLFLSVSGGWLTASIPAGHMAQVAPTQVPSIVPTVVPSPIPTSLPPVVVVPTAQPTATATALPDPAAKSPQDAVQGYYNALLKKDYPLACGYLSASRRAQGDCVSQITSEETASPTLSYQYRLSVQNGNTARTTVTQIQQVGTSQQTTLVAWTLTVDPQGNWRLEQDRSAAVHGPSDQGTPAGRGQGRGRKDARDVAGN